ncbi:minor tail protein [Mycobacterium phage Larenn]|uniref:Minor tail protein n=1 Tax=Mycobacterium phage Larenn TaxID=1560285 RepID=A0A0A0RRF3_9CAUD|nr:minor tail protein [Mycobacterium phage Larenn]AIW02927.1 minor tail protein [Mycobacterium phage Larenn]
MTTYPTTPLEAIGSDGAFEIGGGDFNFGQNYTEQLIRDMVRVPMPTNGNAVQILQDQLKKLPLESLQFFKHIIPGTVDDDFIDITTSVGTIIGNLSNLPKALLSGDFDEWVSSTYQVVSTEVKQILEILGGLIVTPINEAVQAVKDWYHQQQNDIQTALQNGAQQLRDQLTGIVNATPTDVDNWLLSLLTGESMIPKENITGLQTEINNAVTRAQQGIRDALTGVVNSTPTQLDNWVLNLLTGNSTLNASKLSGTAPTAVIPTLPQSKIQNLAQDIASKLGVSDPLDASKLTGTAPAATIPSLGIGKLPDLQSLVDAATNALSGASKSGNEIIGAGLADAKATMEQLFGQLTKVTRDVQALQSENDSTNVGGRRFNVDFSGYPDGAFPSGIFNITYSGPGTSTLGIKNGRAVWNLVDNGDRDALLLYPTPTLTPYQKVRGTLATAPENNSSGQKPRIWSIARANAAGTDYVFARGYCTGFLSYRGDIGCVKNGIEYVWQSNIPLTWNLDMTVICGVGNDPRRHQVLSGDSVVVDLIEPVGAQSVVDNNHCYWGSYTETNGKQTPGQVSGASVVDNAPPAVIGTTFRASRRTTTDTTIPSGTGKLPNNFFETIDYQSDDLTYTPSTNCRLTATKQGTYLVQYRVFHGVWASNNFGYGVLYKNGTLYARGGYTGNQLNLGISLNTTQEDATYASFIVPLNPGDYIEPGFYTTANMSNTGDSSLSDGSQTYFTVTRVGIA